jgi:hypothetical protein
MNDRESQIDGKESVSFKLRKGSSIPVSIN